MLYDNKYEFIRDLGYGGFGKVFLAKEKLAHRLVAIKQLHRAGRTSFDSIIREIQTVSKFNHANIVNYYTHFWQNDNLYLVMEYCEQGCLRDVIKQNPPDDTQVLLWMTTLTTCFRDVHKKNIIHCDIKPENILVTKDGILKISDFGIANTDCRTIAYWSPDEIIDSNSKSTPRTDIYALGVTLTELLTGKNPFSGLSTSEIINKHRQQDYKITNLPQWQQSIILKAIHPVPEERFRFMAEFKEAIEARSVPVIFSDAGLKAAKYVQQGEKAMKSRKWRTALNHLEHAHKQFPHNVQVLECLGRYYLVTQEIDNAKSCIEQACKLNPRLNLQKELGWIHLELGNYPMAISLLSDHLHRQARDLEAYNLLLKCYYESGRYELGIDLATMLLKNYKRSNVFQNNLFVCQLMHDPLFKCNSEEEQLNYFISYNKTVFTEQPSSFNKVRPTLKSKLLFMDWQFEDSAPGVFTILESSDLRIKPRTSRLNLITFGRDSHENDIPVYAGTSVSRRHCVIVNQEKSVWIYDLGSTAGTFLNGERINKKAPLIGMNKLKVGPVELIITTDSTKLL